MRAPPEAAPPRQVPVYRRAASIPRAVRALAFDRLPPAVRDRLTRALAQGAPEALLSAPSGLAPFVLRASRAVAIAAGLGVLGVFINDLGEISGARALQSASFAAVYAALLAVGLLAGGVATAIGRFQRGAPFRSGRYLFSLDLVEADGGRLRVTSLDTLRAVEARQRQVAVVFEDGHAALFPVAQREDPAVLAAQVERSVTRAQKLVYPADEAKLGRLDPFFEVRVTEDWDASADAGERRRPWLGWLTAAVVVGAAPAGYGLLLGRNALSDTLMFDEAQTARPGGESIDSKLCAYAGRGRRHAVEASRRCIEETDYRQAARSPLVGSLLSFVRRHPGSSHEEEAWKRIRQTYADALLAFQAVHRSPPEGLHFVEALLGALLDRADPRVTLDVRVATATAVDEADVALAAKYGDVYLSSAGHFTSEALDGLGRGIRGEVAEWFGRVLPHGVAEITRPAAEDDGRPGFEVVCTPVVDGTSRWQSPEATTPAHVTALVGFLVEVKGLVRRDGKETTLTWKVHLDDTTDPEMAIRDRWGEGFPVERKIDDAFGLFIDGIPARIAASFRDKL